jgi:hypothetical protein
MALGSIEPLSFCDTCWYVEETCARECAADLLELFLREWSKKTTLARVSFILRKSGAPDADYLIAALRRIAA